MNPELVLATGNPGKIAEFSLLLEALGLRVRTLNEFPALGLPPEGDCSYAANALVKARAVTRATQLCALADDSGLEVDALGGAPGLLSARYGGPGLTDQERVQHLLAALGGIREERRAARFRCVVALTVPWGQEAVVEGIAEGRIAPAARGTGGFGYDPIFEIPALGRTFAELSSSEKARVSHRARAIEAARPILERWLGCRGGASSL